MIWQGVFKKMGIFLRVPCFVTVKAVCQAFGGLLSVKGSSLRQSIVSRRKKCTSALLFFYFLLCCQPLLLLCTCVKHHKLLTLWPSWYSSSRTSRYFCDNCKRCFCVCACARVSCHPEHNTHTSSEFLKTTSAQYSSGITAAAAAAVQHQ